MVVLINNNNIGDGGDDYATRFSNNITDNGTSINVNISMIDYTAVIIVIIAAIVIVAD